MMGTLFKRKPKCNPLALPPSVEALLECASVIVRSDDDEGRSRILLSFIGSGKPVTWYHEPAATAKRLAEAFPQLSEGQLELAGRVIASRVRAELADQGRTPGRRKQGSWASWQSARKPIF